MYKWYLPTLSEIIQSGESDVIQSTRSNRPSQEAESQWYGAIAALNDLLVQRQASNLLHKEDVRSKLDTINTIKGLIVSGPFPIINHMDLREHFSTWTLTGDPSLRSGSLQLPAAEAIKNSDRRSPNPSSALPAAEHTLLLHPDDPLTVEPFCLMLSPNLSVILTLGLDDSHAPQFSFSFDPDTIWQGWRSLRSRLQLTTFDSLSKLDCIADQFSPKAPDYRMVMEFSQLMIMQTFKAHDRRVQRNRYVRTGHKPPSNPCTSFSTPSSRAASVNEEKVAADPSRQATSYPSKPLNVNHVNRLKLGDVSWRDVVKPSNAGFLASDKTGKRKPQETRSRQVDSNADRSSSSSSMPKNEIHQSQMDSDAELLKAIAHEVRTPLTTIRTLTRLLMKRKDLVDIVLKRLEQIDRECTKQIDRFSLIFKAVEVETASVSHMPNHLARISLVKMFKQNVSRWQQQAQQRNLTLDVALPPTLPSVMSDPTVLDQVLTGLMDRMTHTLPPGTLIKLSVVPAGHQLKLQFWAKRQVEEASCHMPSSNTFLSTPLDASRKTTHQAATTSNCQPSIFAPTLQAVGQLLMFQPETGNLSLNLDVTKNLFQALGGKLIVRHTPTKGEVLTIFLPMDNTESNALSPSLRGKHFC